MIAVNTVVKMTSKNNDSYRDILASELVEESKKKYGIDISEIDFADISWESIFKSGKHSPTKVKLAEMFRKKDVPENHISLAVLSIIISVKYTHYSERAEEICRTIVEGCSDSDIELFTEELAAFVRP